MWSTLQQKKTKEVDLLKTSLPPLVLSQKKGKEKKLELLLPNCERFMYLGTQFDNSLLLLEIWFTFGQKNVRYWRFFLASPATSSLAKKLNKRNALERDCQGSDDVIVWMNAELQLTQLSEWFPITRGTKTSYITAMALLRLLYRSFKKKRIILLLI